MSPDSDSTDRQVWEDLETLIRRNRQVTPNMIMPGHTSLAVMNVLAVNQCAGMASRELLGMWQGERTIHDVASGLTDVITAAFIALAAFVPDVQEYWEINLRELIVKTEDT